MYDKIQETLTEDLKLQQAAVETRKNLKDSGAELDGT